MNAKHRLKWAGNQEAQKQADAAYSQLIARRVKKKRAKKRAERQTEKLERTVSDELSREFRAIIS